LFILYDSYIHTIHTTIYKQWTLPKINEEWSVQGQINQTISWITAIRRFGDQHLVNSDFQNFQEKQKTDLYITHFPNAESIDRWSFSVWPQICMGWRMPSSRCGDVIITSNIFSFQNLLASFIVRRVREFFIVCFTIYDILNVYQNCSFASYV